MSSYQVALDAMGGDHGPSVVVPAALNALVHFPDLELILVGDRKQIEPRLHRAAASERERLHIRHAAEVVAMDEPPSQALRNKKDSSMRVAINLVKEGQAAACVSAGNTGALMATGRYVLKTLSGIDRPAIIAALPSKQGHTQMLDLGANVDCTAEHLYEFAVMGSVVCEVVDGISKPRIGLLNIGQEIIKGNEQVKQAGARLERSDLNYIGYVEGDDIYLGGVDVVVCDGFVGNVSLKTSEGVAKLISGLMRSEFKRNPLTKLAGLVAQPVMHGLRKRIDPRLYNGASLVGLRGVVIKSHGGTDRIGFENAIRIARLEAEANVTQRISNNLKQLLNQRLVS
mgnify:CR=1 FL=1